MKKTSQKKLAYLICAVLCAITFSGCTVGETQIFFSAGPGFHNVFRIGNLKCSEKEAKVYLANTKNLYGVVGDALLWQDGFKTDMLEASLRDGVLYHLTRVYALNIYAKEQEITLTEREEESVKKAAEEYFDSLSKTERSLLDVNESDIEEMYMRYALAKKVYVLLMEQVDEEVSEDEARIIDAYVLKVNDEAMAKKVGDLLAQGTSFSNVLISYGQGDKSLQSFGRGTFPDEMEDVIFQLDNEQVSDCIHTGEGYYYVLCMNKYNEELSEANKKSVVDKRKEQTIANIISEQNQTYYSQINEELWSSISLSDFDEISSDSFFSVLDENVGF